MTITATRLQQFHSGSSAAATRSFTGVTLTAGRRYAVVCHALRNASGDWFPTTQVTVSDNATAPSGWAVAAVSADPASNQGTANRSSCTIALTGTITATQTGRTVTIDPQNTTTTQFINVWALYEISTDGAEEIELVQAAGAVGASAGTKPDLNWPATPAGFQLVAWATIHNSTLSFPTEPTGYTADYTNVNGTCGIEIQTADGVTTDPVSFSPTVSGTQFSFHVAGIELSDTPASTETEAPAGAATAAGSAPAALATVQPTAGPATTTSSAGQTVPILAPAAGPASSAGAAPQATVATTVQPAAGPATGSAQAPPASTTVEPTAGPASAAGAAPAATTTITAPAGGGGGAAAAGQATVSATAAGTAPADTAVGAGRASPTTTSIQPTAGTAASTSSAGRATVAAGVTASPAPATAAGAGGTATTTITATAGAASAGAAAGGATTNSAAVPPGPPRFTTRTRPAAGLAATSRPMAGLAARSRPGPVLAGSAAPTATLTGR